MKKIFSFAFILAAGFFAHAQMTMSSYNPYNSGSSPQPLTNGQEWVTSTVSEQGATLYFYINNNYDHDIYVKARVESITNDSGSNFQFCFGENCVFSITEGNTYTGYQQYVTIPAGGTNSMWDKLYNESASGDAPKSFVFKFFRVDQQGNELDEAFYLTYKYDPTASVNPTAEQHVMQLSSNLIKSSLDFQLLEEASMTIFDANGKQVIQQNFVAGWHQYNVDHLAKGMYIVKVNGAQNQNSTLKFIKQ